MEDKILTAREVCELLTIGNTTLYNMISNGEFPPPYQLCKRRSGWLYSDVIAWLKSRPQCVATSDAEESSDT